MYYAQGVEVTTAVLPHGWRPRLVRVEGQEAGIDPAVITAWCLEVHDLWASKAAAGRGKDSGFCLALARAGLVDEPTCRRRIAGFAGGDATRAGAVAARCFGSPTG
ncbi:MAG TPA: hypothetical protein VHL53_12140 [Acidimicrobiia bacterium]|nr:hypothetical protein [Acidimicrobiia bacterium]